MKVLGSVSTLGALLVASRAAEEVATSFEEPDTSGLEFAATFQDDPFASGAWVKSNVSKYAAQQVEVRGSDVEGFEADKELVLVAANRHYGVAAPFAAPIQNTDGRDLVVQYEVALTGGLTCGGAYLKLLRDPLPEGGAAALADDTPYSIMFGPDRCGATDKVHFILQHRSPVTGAWEEKHLGGAPRVKNDKKHHVYTLALRGGDASYEIFIDGRSESKGSLREALQPPIEPSETIDDPADTKPDDWVDEAKIPDPDAVKPDDWDETAPARIADPEATKPEGWLEDEPLTVPDPTAAQPENWDEEEDGAFEAPPVENPRCANAPGCGPWSPPMIANPAYKGRWRAPLIDNPAYRGPFVPRQIPNPEHFEEPRPAQVPAIAGVAVEVWTTNGGIALDNIVVGYDVDAALAFAQRTWGLKSAAEKRAAAAAAAAASKSGAGGGADFAASTLAQRQLLMEQGGAANVAKAGALLAQEWSLRAVAAARDAPAALAGTLAAVLLGVLAIALLPGRRRKKGGAAAAAAAQRAAVPDEGFEETKGDSTEPPSRESAAAAAAAAAADDDSAQEED